MLPLGFISAACLLQVHFRLVAAMVRLCLNVAPLNSVTAVSGVRNDINVNHICNVVEVASKPMSIASAGSVAVWLRLCFNTTVACV